MVHEPDLLVHISQAATRQNDHLYRSLAAAYLDFDPVQRHENRSTQAHEDVSSQHAGTSRLSERDSVVENQGISSFMETSMVSTNQDSYGSFPEGVEFDGVDEFVSLPDSRLGRLDRIQRKWKVQVVSTSRSSAGGRLGGERDGTSSDGEEDVDTAFIEDTQEARLALQSQMPDSFGVEEDDDDDDDGGSVGTESDEGEREDAGIFTQEASLRDAELAEWTSGTTGVLQSELEDSSLISWEDLEEDAEDAAKVTEEVSPSSDKAADRTTTTFTEDAVSPRPAPCPKDLATAVDRRESTRLKELRDAEDAFKDDPNPASGGPLKGKQRGSRSTDASKLAAPFKVPTTIANRRKSTRLEEKAGAAELKTPASSTPRLESSSVSRQQRLNETSSPAAASPAQDKARGISTSVHEPDKPDPPIDFSALPFSVLAPEPKIGITSPTTWPSQITPYLASLKTQHPTLFQPTKKLHSPAPDTRGWWSVDCSKWGAQAQKEFWDAMCKVLEDGRLGWATSLHREVGAQDLGVVRVYCWGELVECMWLVLWRCSEGRVHGQRCKWFDAERIVVFETE